MWWICNKWMRVLMAEWSLTKDSLTPPIGKIAAKRNPRGRKWHRRSTRCNDSIGEINYTERSPNSRPTRSASDSALLLSTPTAIILDSKLKQSFLTKAAMKKMRKEFIKLSQWLFFNGYLGNDNWNRKPKKIGFVASNDETPPGSNRDNGKLTPPV